MRFTPVTAFVLLLLGSIAIHFILPTTKVIPFPYYFLGSFFIIFGIILNYWADAQFKKKQTTILPHEMPTFLVTYGIFRISRNPIYLGMASILLGIAIFFGTLIAFIFPLTFIIYIGKFIIPIEEKNLEQKFGKRYVRYKKKVRRWGLI
jgi:protein-S-isoprenylcysteine O-methyltransferase Ste14